MSRRGGVGLGLSLLLGAWTELPKDVAQAVQRSLAEMQEPNDPAAVARLASRTSVSPSGDDWVIDYEKTGDTGWCGSGGCTRELWVAREGWHILAFSEQVQDWRLTPGSPAVLDIDIHGANCDATASDPCLRRFAWNEATGRLEEAFNREGEGYLIGPLFQPVEPEPYPAAVQAEIDRREALCHAAGGQVDGADYPAVTSPDLNGDGRRDWIVGSRYIGCHSPVDEALAMPVLGVTVIVSVDDGWTTALTEQNPNYVVELGLNAPAQFGLRDEALCQNAPACPTRYFAWDATSRTLQDRHETRWSPRRIVNAETWLDCLAAGRAVAREYAGKRGGADLDRSRAVQGGLLQDYAAKYDAVKPRLSSADETDRKLAFARRYDEPQELEAARWRNDLCVTLL